MKSKASNFNYADFESINNVALTCPGTEESTSHEYILGISIVRLKYKKMTNPLQTVPKGYHTVTPWIIAKGASELVTFIENVFGGKEKEGSRMPNTDGSIGHVEVQVGDSVIMLFDHKPAWPETPSFMRLYVEDAAAVLKRAEEAGATVITKLTPLFFGETVARIHDSWGNLWWIHQRTEELDLVEQKKRMDDPEAMKNMRYVQESLEEALGSEASK